MTLSSPCALINSWQTSLLAYKNPIFFLEFKFPSLLTRSIKFGNFFYNISVLATKYEIITSLLILLNSSGDKVNSFWSTSTSIFKTNAVNERKAFIWSLLVQWYFNGINLPSVLPLSQVFFKVLILFNSPSNLMQVLYFKLKTFPFSFFSFSSHREISIPGFSRAHFLIRCRAISHKSTITIIYKNLYLT